MSLWLVKGLWNRKEAAKSGSDSRRSDAIPERVPQVVILGRGREAAEMSSTLRRAGIQACPVNSVEEAADLVRAKSVRLALVDETFFTSAAVGWHLRQDRIIPIVLLGNAREREGWDKAIALEADGYICRCAPRAEQVARIKAIIRRG